MEEKGKNVLKVVVFDCGYGGEFFADKLEVDLPVLEIIRVIDWRNADKYLKNPRLARKYAREALRPYLGRVDLIILANHLLSITSLKYFQHKFKPQKFVGFNLKQPDSFVKRDVLVLTTKAVTKTTSYYNYLFHLKRKIKTLTLDDWPAKIDDGELASEEIRAAILKPLFRENFRPQEIVLACSQFEDIKPELRAIFSRNIKIYDSYGDTLRKICKTLKIRGGTGKKPKL